MDLREKIEKIYTEGFLEDEDIDITVDKTLALLSQWTRVDDVLPENNLSVWVLTYELVFGIQYCARGSVVWSNTQPTHWMPLPQPPKGG